MKLVNKSITFLCFVLLLAVSGCMTPEEIRQQAQKVQNERISKCNSYGFRQGTQAFGNCMIQLENQAQLEDRCNSVYLAAFSTADPARGFGYAGGVATQAKNDCLAGRAPQQKRSVTCRQVGSDTKCSED